MDASPSNASLTSSKKPSTANSTSSKRSRTIIVARNIPDAPSASGAAAGGIVCRTAGGGGTNAIGSSDTKLSAYSALGSSEDVHLYQKYLLDQAKSNRLNASEQRGASVGHHSPQHLTASMKRKTISQLSIGNNITEVPSGSRSTGPLSVQTSDSQGAETDTKSANAGADAAARAGMQVEMARDAKTRREAIVQQRKWLQTLPIHERLAHQRQQNALRRWQQINRDWETFKTRACKKLGKFDEELVMSRATKYREQVEMLDALQKARPLADKVGGDIWLVSLRNDGTRFVPVGNIFSGLFCPIRESTRLGPRVRRPLDHYDPTSSHNREFEELDKEEDEENSRSNATSKPVSMLEKRSLELLAKKKRRLRKQLHVLLPHEVEDSASSRLVVETMDLFEWASRSDASSLLTSDAATLSLPLEEEYATGSHKGSLPSSARPEANNAPLRGPSLQIAVEGEKDEANGHQQPNGDDGDNAPLRLSFYGDTSQLVQHSVALTNDGSTVLHYQWTRGEFSHPIITPHLTGNHGKSRSEQLDTESNRSSNQDEAQYHRANNTFVSQAQGCILPGESERFVFGFTSQRPGLYLEKWVLDVDPPARIRCGTASVSTITNTVDAAGGINSSPRAAAPVKFDYKPVELHLKCTAVDNFVPTKQHVAQKSEIYKKQTVFMVEQLVEDVLRKVHSPPKVNFSELSAAAHQFYELNHDTFGDVYFSEALVTQCRELYVQARQVLLQAASSYEALPVSGDTTAGDSDGAIVDAQIKVTTPRPVSSDGAQDSARPVTSPADAVGSGAAQDVEQGALLLNEGEWDLRLSTLRAVVREADDRNAAKLKTLATELKKIVEMEDEEEEEEEDEEQEEEDEDDEDDEEDSEDDDDNPKDQGSKPPKKQTIQEKREARAAHREQIRQERREKCLELEESIALLRPQLQDTFRLMYLEAFAPPYDSSTLRQQLAQRIANMCSEVPVIHAITRMQQQLQSGTSDAREKETEKGVAQLLIRAVDEAVAWDLAYQLQYEHERKRFQRVLLSEKLTFEQALGQGSPGIHFSKGVLVLQVDLDLAHWFTLVKERALVPTLGFASSNEASFDPLTAQAASETPLGLQWQFASELLDRDDFVPEKVSRTVKCLAALMQLILVSGSGDGSENIQVKAIVLVSDLSSPPLTKAMKKLLGATIKQQPSGTEKIDPDREEQRMLDSITHQVSLEPVSKVLERAIGSSGEAATVAFCASLDDLAAKLSLLTPPASEDPPTVSEANEEADSAALDDSGTLVRSPPKLFLMENLKTLAAPTGGKRKSIGAGERPPTAAATPQSPAAVLTLPAAAIAPPDPKVTAAARKKSVAPQTKPVTDAKTTAVAPTLPVIPAATPVPESAPTTRAEEKPVNGNDSTLVSSTSVERMQAETIGLKLADLCDAFVVDALLPSPWESVFVSTIHEQDTKKKPVMLGLNLMERVEHWARILQPPPVNSEPSSAPMTTAVVGGKNLAGKLRMIDNLLEVADAVYFVGDVALSLYRVLFTKHDNMRRRWRKLPPRFPQSLWSILVPAVEKLKQKAQRKGVKLLLPVDWIVGDASLDEQDTTSGHDDDDDDEDDEDAEEEDDDEGGGVGNRQKSTKSKKRKQQQLKKPIVEPEEIDSWRSKPSQWQYSGEKAHVGMTMNDEDAWASIFDVDYDVFSRFRVLKGSASLLVPKATGDKDENGDEDEAEHGNEELDPSHNGVSAGEQAGEDAQTGNRELDASELDNPTMFEFEWTFRAFDVGPLSMQILFKTLQQQQQHVSQWEKCVILHGLFGVVECQDFDSATREFVSFLAGWSSNSPLEVAGELPVLSPHLDTSSTASQCQLPKLLVSGEATLEWVQRFESDTRLKAKLRSPEQQQQQSPPRRLVTNQDRKMAHMLRDVLSAKPNAVLLIFDPPSSTEAVRPTSATYTEEELVAEKSE